MPTYEYQCTECGSVFDMFQSIKAPPLRKAMCENCGTQRPVRRLIGTGGAVLFKGSGFYQTDYRSKGYAKAADAESGKKQEAGRSDSAKDSPQKAAASKAGDKDAKPRTHGGKKDSTATPE